MSVLRGVKRYVRLSVDTKRLSDKFGMLAHLVRRPYLGNLEIEEKAIVTTRSDGWAYNPQTYLIIDPGSRIVEGVSTQSRSSAFDDGTVVFVSNEPSPAPPSISWEDVISAKYTNSPPHVKNTAVGTSFWSNRDASVHARLGSF